MTQSPAHKWTFARHFRKGVYGWKSSRLAAKRVGQAVSEIRKVARKEPLRGADGATELLRRLSPSFEHVDDSWGILGRAVREAIGDLATLIGSTPADEGTRDRWLRRLWRALEDDGAGYLDMLTDRWGTLCGSPETASRWADEFLPLTRTALRPDRNRGDYFPGSSACLSCLLAARRYEELLGLVAHETWWHYRKFGVDALLAMGRTEEALRFAEASRSRGLVRPGFVATDDVFIDRKCEEILISAGRVDEAYEHYAVSTARGSTMLSRFREIVERYPKKDERRILEDLIRSTPGEEGKWFATAHQLGLYDLAIDLANRSPCDPRTLGRAAQKRLKERPEFALQAALAAVRWLCAGYGYEITGADVYLVYRVALEAGDALGVGGETRERVSGILENDRSVGKFVSRALSGHRRQ